MTPKGKIQTQLRGYEAFMDAISRLVPIVPIGASVINDRATVDAVYNIRILAVMAIDHLIR